MSIFLLILWVSKVLLEIDGLCKSSMLFITLGGPILIKRLMPINPYFLLFRRNRLIEPIAFESLTHIQRKILRFRMTQYRIDNKKIWLIALLLLIPIVLSYFISPRPFIKKSLYADINFKIMIRGIINIFINIVGILGISFFYGVIIPAGIFESWSFFKIIKNWEKIIYEEAPISKKEYTNAFHA